MSNDNMTTMLTEGQISALAADVRRSLSEAQATHLDQLEVRIRDQRERFTQGLLEIGRCLVEAKEAQLVPHGCWQDWVAAHTGLSLRSAQRLMRAAREIPKTSALSHLDFSKISALLALPAEEREDFARENDAENATLRQLEAAIREKKEAERQRDQAREEKERDQRKIGVLERQLEDAEYALNNIPVVEREVPPADYEAMKARDLAAAARIREAEDYAEAQEERVRALQAELDAARAEDGHGDEVQRFIAACSTFYGEVCRYQNQGDAQLLGGKSRADLESMRSWVGMIRAWCGTMDVRLSERTGVEVDGDVR